MLKGEFSYTPPTALTGSLRDFRRARGADLQARLEGFAKWRNLRAQHGLWPFSRVRDGAAAAAASAEDGAGGRIEGLNFASDDPLNLGAHPAVVAAAKAAIDTFGVHSAGPGAALGATTPCTELEQNMADFLAAPQAALFPSGWAAAYSAVKALVRSTDHLVMDALAPAGLREAAAAATRNLYLFRGARVETCREWLEKIRRTDAENGIVLAVETISAADGEPADLAALQALCHEFGATFLVYAAHDLGALGADGKGVLGEQAMLGKVDVVAGSFARAFGAGGGFVAGRSSELVEYVRAFSSAWNQSAALPPVQAAALVAALEIVESADGQARRDRLMRNIEALRGKLTEAGLPILGPPASVVCVELGADGLARLIARRLPDAGLIANLMEFPAAPKDQARLKLHVMADHSDEDIDRAAAAVAAACQAGREEFDHLNSEREKLRARG
jgi:glycine C-acetyltransferase